MKKPLEECSREELIETIKCQRETIARTKKFGLAWEDKPEKVATDCVKKLPVLKEVDNKAIHRADEFAPANIIIEGDNYHALSALNYTHAGKIDVIYIDPPYNTGSQDFVYNDKYVNTDDVYRHSKWLSFMEKRLSLAKMLLTKDGLILISIDDNEQAHLKLLCDKIFGEDKFVAEFIIDKTAQGANQSTTFKTQHEFCLMYANSQKMINYNVQSEVDPKKYKYMDAKGRYAITNAFDSINSPLMSNKNRGYTVYYDEKTGNAVVKDEYDKTNNVFGDYDENLLEQGFAPIRPGVRKNIQYPWNWMLSRFEREYKENLVFMKNKKGQWGIYHKNRATGLVKDTTIKRFDTRKLGNQALNEILEEKKFDYPKSLDMMMWAISKHKSKDLIVLDFFAGSGTTGQAVLELNKKDEGDRKFILCTNNENNIAEEVTYPRIKTVVTGIRADGSKYSDGLLANVRYFKTDFIDKNDTIDKLRRELSPACEDMIRIRESAYEKIIDDDMLKVFKNSRGLTAIIYDRFELAKHIEKIEALETDSPVHLYVFSYSKSDRRDEMPENLKHKYEIQPIPEGVLEIYKKIFANIKGGKNA